MKYALVTGSTKGIGFAIAKRLIEHDYFVFVNGRDTAVLDLAPDKHLLITADLSTSRGVDALTDAISQYQLDCIVLNAGATCRKELAAITYDDWQTVMDTNVNMPFFLVQRVFDRIADGGSVVFISSAMSLKPHAISLPYGVSKAAVNALAQGLVKEFAPRRIRVNAVCPGFVDTEWQKEKPQWLREKTENKIALKRYASPDEIADICFCVINNSYINGAVVPADGGYDSE